MSGNWGLLVLELIGGGALAAALIYVAAVRYRRFWIGPRYKWIDDSLRQRQAESLKETAPGGSS